IVLPLSSSLSEKLYFSIGFRDTGRLGAVIIILACIGFLILPYPQSITLLVLDQVLLGAGFGLLSTPMLVGVQSVVGRERRGVVTGTNMFCRYLGQGLGSSIFGAIFNNSFQHQMADGPKELADMGTNVFDMM